MFGYRPDGRRLKDVDPIVQITPYLMPMRCDAQVFLQHNLDYEKMSRYIAAKSREGEKITFMNIIGGTSSGSEPLYLQQAVLQPQ